MYALAVETVGQTVFYLAVATAVVAGVVYFCGLVWTLGLAVSHRRPCRPMWVNYAAWGFGMALPVMVIGLVLRGRLDWWFLIVFAPFVVSRFILFRMGTSITRRNEASDKHT